MAVGRDWIWGDGLGVAPAPLLIFPKFYINEIEIQPEKTIFNRFITKKSISDFKIWFNKL